MSKTCEVCGKHPRSGNTVSHAHNVNKRIFYPNLRTIKQIINGTPTKIKICMKCLKTMSKNK
ncbi:MAG: 50S ribosomal protein L28 [Fibrobacter sp.]|nr:50S ribosomal protein L28 [Fibrobacter sp.]